MDASKLLAPLRPMLALLLLTADGLALTPLPPPEPLVVYGTRTTRRTPRRPSLGPVELAGRLGASSYEVLRSTRLGVPADSGTPATLKGYRLRRAPDTAPFAPLSGVRLVSPCGEILVELRRPDRLLIPASPSLSGLPPPPPSEPDHFLCYRAKVQRRLPDGTPLPGLPSGRQLELSDLFQTRRYDLGGLTRVCAPTAKTGSPVILSGRARGVPFPIEPAFPARPDVLLACYRAKPAHVAIEQSECGPTDPKDRGVRIQPPQPPHQSQRDVHLLDQLGLEQVDTRPEREICLPIARDPACGNGVVDSLVGETCDDGNLVSGDGCNELCQAEFCGDSLLQPGIGEECDGASDAACPGECRPDCLCPRPCAHGVCQTGGPLDRFCDPCVTTVCAVDPFCCEVSWDGLCVYEADLLCSGVSCTPYGSPSSAFLEMPRALID